jgi:imidazolonepropionase-like amidohydrolase
MRATRLFPAILFFYFTFHLLATAQMATNPSFYLLKPDQIFDGEKMQEGGQVLIKNNKIEAIGSFIELPAGTEVIELKGKTLLPGLIEGHSHLFLHPYNETSWNDQVLKESRPERTVRATVHARNTLLAGFTTARDLGTEGAGYDDVGLKEAIIKGIIPGSRLLVATKAIVATGSYGPKELTYDIAVPQGAAEADGNEGLVKEIRTQIGKGADLIKVYADYGWGLNKQTQPTFTTEELKKAVEVAGSSGRTVVAHASTPEGMRRAIMAGVATIEHGDQGTANIFKLMRQKGVALCPTLAAGHAIAQYRGWRPGQDPEPARLQEKRKSFAAALAAGVTICMGGDAGVFTHGENAREMELMVTYGMKPLAVLRAATSVNAAIFKVNETVGRIKAGLLADIIAVDGRPDQDISHLRKVSFVMKDGIIYKR